MPPPPQDGPFSMPMYRDRVPEAIRPWIYLVLAFTFQLSGTYYLGALSQIVGTTGFMREDVTMVAMMGVVGVNMPFPFLFKFKFRFTNHQMLLFYAAVIAVCNVLSIYVTWLPLLCAISFVAGFFKLCGTFECFSNVRLWISPSRNFGIFLPTIYILILAAHGGSAWLAREVTYYCGTWQAMNWLMAGMMLVVMLVVFTLTRNFRFMKPQPLLSLDWLGCLLWAAVMLEVIWLFTYGEYYNWTDGATWRGVLIALPVTLGLAIGRMRHIRHPYIDPEVWRHSRLWPILGMFAVAEMMNASAHVLLPSLTGGVLHWGMLTTNVLNLYDMLGMGLGCALVVLWCTRVKRPFTQLLTVGFAMLLLHQVMMYFGVSHTLPIERLYLPTVLRGMGYGVFFSTMTLYLNELYGFVTFFMSLTISGFIRNGVVESVFAGIYSYSLRYHVADNMARGVPYDMAQTLMVAIKQSYGLICLVGVVILLLMMTYEFQPVRSTFKKMPHLGVIRRLYRRLARND